MVLNIFYFHPDPWENDPIWRAYKFFRWVEVQPPTRFSILRKVQKKKGCTLRLLTPPMETPDPPNDTPGALKQVVLTPHDIPWSLRVNHNPKGPVSWLDRWPLLRSLTAFSQHLRWCHRNQRISALITLRKLTCPLKKDPFKRKVDFQPSFLSGYD